LLWLNPLWPEDIDAICGIIKKAGNDRQAEKSRYSRKRMLQY